MATLTPEIEKLTLLQAAKFLHAYLECSDEIRAGIRNLLEILNDPNTDEDDRDMTLFTLADALFPDPVRESWAWIWKNGRRRVPATRRKLAQHSEEMDGKRRRLRGDCGRDGQERDHSGTTRRENRCRPTGNLEHAQSSVPTPTPNRSSPCGRAGCCPG